MDGKFEDRQITQTMDSHRTRIWKQNIFTHVTLIPFLFLLLLRALFKHFQTCKFLQIYRSTSGSTSHPSHVKEFECYQGTILYRPTKSSIPIVNSN
jgi:hypothetical protein